MDYLERVSRVSGTVKHDLEDIFGDIGQIYYLPAHLNGKAGVFPIGSSTFLVDQDDLGATVQTIGTRPNLQIFAKLRVMEDVDQKIDDFFYDVIAHETLHSIFSRRYLKAVGDRLNWSNSPAFDLGSYLVASEQSLRGYGLTFGEVRLISEDTMATINKLGIPPQYLSPNPIMRGVDEAFAYVLTEFFSGRRGLYEQTANLYDESVKGTSSFLKFFYREFIDVIKDKDLDYLLKNLPDIVEHKLHKFEDVKLKELPDEVLNYIAFMETHIYFQEDGKPIRMQAPVRPVTKNKLAAIRAIQNRNRS